MDTAAGFKSSCFSVKQMSLAGKGGGREKGASQLHGIELFKYHLSQTSGSRLTCRLPMKGG